MRWSHEETTTLRKCIKQGFCIAAIAERIDRSASAIEDKIRKLNLRPKRDGRKKFSEGERRVIIDMRRRGCTFREISARLKRSSAQCRVEAGRLGITQKKSVGAGPPIPRRKCLMHGKMFQPAHRHEFVCKTCKDTSVWRESSML